MPTGPATIKPMLISMVEDELYPTDIKYSFGKNLFFLSCSEKNCF